MMTSNTLDKVVGDSVHDDVNNLNTADSLILLDSAKRGRHTSNEMEPLAKRQTSSSRSQQQDKEIEKEIEIEIEKEIEKESPPLLANPHMCLEFGYQLIDNSASSDSHRWIALAYAREYIRQGAFGDDSKRELISMATRGRLRSAQELHALLATRTVVPSERPSLMSRRLDSSLT